MELDLALHAIPGTTLVLDFFLFEEKYAKKQARLGGAAVAIAAGLWYSCWAEYCASFNGICESLSLVSDKSLSLICDALFTVPYPFLTFNPFHIRVAIYSGVTLFAYTIFQLLNWIHA